MRLWTGFKVIDRVIGGIPSRTSLLVSGPKHTGKTYFSSKMFASNVRRGNPALFVSLDRPSSDMIPMFTQLIGRKALASLLEKETARFFDLYEYDFEEKDLTLKELYYQVAREFKAADVPPALLVMDSFNRITNSYSKTSVSWFVSRLSRTAKEFGSSCVFVVRTGPGSPVLRKKADGEILFRRAEEKIIIKAGLPNKARRIFMGEYDGRRLKLLDVID